jgi:ParB family chromosome partitioning protein
MSVRKRTSQPYQIKGVDALFGETEQTETENRHIATADLAPFGQQPRRYFDPEKLNQLVESIKQHGILEPLLVRSTAHGKYEIVAGERRYRAATMLGLTEVPVVIRDFSDQEALQVALIENLQREDLNPIEETEGILELVAIRLQKDVEYVITLLSQAAHPERNSVDNVIHREEWQVLQKIFDTVGRFTPESFRTNRLPLLNLPVDILNALREGKIAYTKARAIARVKDEDQRSQLLQQAIAKELSLNEIKAAIKELAPEPDLTPEKVMAQRWSEIGKRFQQGKVLSDRKKRDRITKLLDELEKLTKEV